MKVNIENKDKSDLNKSKTASNCKISTFRRIAPQAIVTVIKNLIILNKSCFDGFSALIIPSLLGIATALNPNETIQITANQASWLSSFTFIGHPFGSLLSGFVSDALGRRKALLFIVAPAVFAFVALGLADSYAVICACFFFLSFIFGLKDAPAIVYVSEVSQPGIRGTLLSITPIARNAGQFLVFFLGSFLSWRDVSFASAALPIIIVTAICFIPESPNWLLSKHRVKDARKSLQWLRGWVSPDAVRDELARLENHSALTNQTTFWEKCRELRRQRTLKPFILAIILVLLLEFSGSMVWRAYINQVLKAYGMPWDANFIMTILSSISIAGSCCVLLTVKTIGKRRLYMYSTIIVVLCAVGLSTFGFVFFPPNWTSFENPTDSAIPNFDLIRDIVGNYGYVALTLLFIMKFCSCLGLEGVPPMVYAEIYSFKLRSFLCGLTLAIRYIFASIATKSYYNIEVWLTLPGAVLFYATISLIGLITMYFILPETEGRSLEDIELHYADNTKKITDIHICIKADFKNV